MRLLNTKTAVLHQFNNPADIPPYAILSHVWQKEEQTLQDISDPARRDAAHPWSHISPKIRDCCAFAAREGFEWIWIDTCCIDKTSSSELSEAINSMYAWYAAADVCYAWLHDVDDTHPSKSGPSSFSQSAWFTRGWTLQELLAPHYVVFLSRKWHTLGTKQTLAHRVSRITGIDEDVLLKTVDLHEVGVARRMSWASTRRTTREEDRAYSLMGIFDVNMPTIYGEGSKAFLRLQVEILKLCPDQSIFAWGRPTIDYHTLIDFSSSTVTKELRDSSLRSLLAPSPAEFQHASGISPISLHNLSELLEQHDLAPSEYSTTAYGMRTSFPVVDIPSLGRDPGILIAILACQDTQGNLIVLFLNHRRFLWMSTPKYLVCQVGADLYPKALPSPPSQYHRLGRLHLGAQDKQSFLENLTVHPLFIEYNPLSVKSSPPSMISPHSHRSSRVLYAFFFPSWLLGSAGVTATLVGHQTLEDDDGIMVEFTHGGPTQRTIIFARDSPPSSSPRRGIGEPQGIRLNLFSHCSCEANPLRHPMSLAVDMMVPEHDSRLDGHASSGRHGRRRSLSAILKDNHQFVQMILNAPASPSSSEGVRLPTRSGCTLGQGSALEGEVEEAWQCTNKRTHIPTISNPNILLSFNSVLGNASIGLKRWNGCRKSMATYVYIVELKIISPNLVHDPERQASLPTYTHGVVSDTGVIVYPNEETSGCRTRRDMLGLTTHYGDGIRNDHPPPADAFGPMIVVEGEQPLVEEGTSEGAILSPLSSTWSSSFDEEFPSHSEHIRRHSSSSLRVLSPPLYYAPTPPTSLDPFASSPLSSHGSSSRLGFHTPEPLPSPFLSPNLRVTSQLPDPSFTPSSSPMIDITGLSPEMRSHPPLQITSVQLSQSELAPEGPDSQTSYTFSQAPTHSAEYLHAPVPLPYGLPPGFTPF